MLNLTALTDAVAEVVAKLNTPVPPVDDSADQAAIDALTAQLKAAAESPVV